jgi:hypothetical protein
VAVYSSAKPWRGKLRNFIAYIGNSEILDFKYSIFSMSRYENAGGINFALVWSLLNQDRKLEESTEAFAPRLPLIGREIPLTEIVRAGSKEKISNSYPLMRRTPYDRALSDEKN